MFYPTKYETTLKATTGKWYTLARRIALISMILSGFVFGYVNASVGFWMLLIGAFVQSSLIGREYYIDYNWQIQKRGELLERLLLCGERKTVFKHLNEAAIWIGNEPDPGITKQLEEMETAEEAFKSRVNKFLEDLTASFEKNTTPPDEPKSN